GAVGGCRAGDVSNRQGSTAAPDVEGGALDVQGIVGQEVEPFLLHRAAAPTGHAPRLDLEVDPDVAAREVADATLFAIVPAALAAGPAGRFFDRRVRRMLRAWGSPKIPVTVGLGWKPGKRYASHSRRGCAGVGVRRSSSAPSSASAYFRPLPERLPDPTGPSFHPLTSTKSLIPIIGAELFRVPTNFFQGSFDLPELVRRNFGEGSSNMSSMLPKDGDDEFLATRSERDDTDAPVFAAFDTGHESLTVEAVNRNTDRPRSEVHLRPDRIHR